MWCDSHWLCYQVPAEQLIIDNTLLPCVNKVHDLGAYLDSDMSMVSHITQTVCVCCTRLRQICSIRCSVTAYYCAVIYHQITFYDESRLLQHYFGRSASIGPATTSDINDAARLTASARKYDHVTLLLKDLFGCECRNVSSTSCVS